MKNRIKENFIYYLISLLFGFIFTLRLQIDYSEHIPDYFINYFHFDLLFFIKVITISFICYFIFQLLLKLLSKIKTKEMIVPYSSKVICSISFFGILITNLIFLLTYYPGPNMNDTLAIIKNPISSVTYRIFLKLFNNMDLAFFFTSFIQLIVMDVIITYLIHWFHKTFKNKTSTILLLIYFIFLPIIANYNTVLIKDSLFSGVLLLHIPLLYKLIETKGDCLKSIQYLVKMFIIFLFTILLCNNGLYLILFLSIVLLIIYKKYWKQFIPTILITLLISQLPNLFIVKSEKLFQEKVEISIQQLAYTITYDEKNLSDKDLNYIDKIMSVDKIKVNYNPYSVDTIKWHKDFNREYLNQTKNIFLKTWFSNLPNHLEAYAKGYLLTTYELWSIEKFNPNQNNFLEIDKNDYYDTNYYKGLIHKQIFPTKIQNLLENYYENTVLFFGNGTCFWLLIILCLLAIYKNKKEIIILSISLIAIWCNLMLSASISYAFKYMIPYLYSFPFLFFITFCYKERS